MKATYPITNPLAPHACNGCDEYRDHEAPAFCKDCDEVTGSYATAVEPVSEMFW